MKKMKKITTRAEESIIRNLNKRLRKGKQRKGKINFKKNENIKQNTGDDHLKY